LADPGDSLRGAGGVARMDNVNAVPPMPVNLLLILAAAGIAIVFGQNTSVHVLLVIAFLAAAVAVIIRVTPPDAIPPDLIDVRGTDRDLTIGAYAGALTAGAVALLIAFVWTSGALALLGLVAVWVIVWWPRWLRTFTLTTHIVIGRDPATVFGFFSNLENWPRFQTVVEHVEKLTPGPIGPGTQFSSRARLPESVRVRWHVFEGIEEIVDYEPNHRVTSRTSSVPDFNFDVKTFDEVSSRTLVTHRFDFVHPYSTAVTAGLVIYGRTTNRLLRTNRDEAWARAKEILESDEQATP
jgi:polyketide cyclase/dehydrase/lipid transport protein